MASLAARKSPFSGAWYPAEASELNHVLDQAFESSIRRTGAAVRPGGVGFIAPHAAPMYSGAVAASVYRHAAARKPRRVIVLGFLHRGSSRGIAMPDIGAISTPLGDAVVDRRTIEALDGRAAFHIERDTSVCDHSVEIQLPFIQRIMPHAMVTPLYVGRLYPEERAQSAAALRSMLNGDSVLIASSDLTHYGRSFGYLPFPVTGQTPERLRDLDQSVMDAAGSVDPDLFLEELRRNGSTTCGFDPIALLLETLRGLPGDEIFAEKLDYQASGEITGDWAHSVSYGGLGFFPASAFRIDEADQARLTESARKTLDELQRSGDRRGVAPSESEALERRAGVFVTLYADGEVRGCVGRCIDCMPLAEAVPSLTLASALDDYRFDRVTASECLDIEMHVLTPMKRIRRPEQLIVDEHGAYLEHGTHRGLLLPKVATERGWNREQFLRALAGKAGVPSATYDGPQARLYVFRDQVFGERTRLEAAAGGPTSQ